MSKARTVGSNVIPFPNRAPAPQQQPAVPDFDPNNPHHVRAWRAMFDFARFMEAHPEYQR